MATNPSLFARKLRAWRTRHGNRGRMTQEALAERLGVSVDAIGKYERSVSFIRGDLEHRLADRLGWGQDDILLCREDWETRQRHGNRTGYQLLDDALVKEHFDGSWPDAIRAMIAVAEDELGVLPDEFAATEKVFLPIYNTFRAHWGAVMQQDQVVAKWALPFLLPEGEAQFRAGHLIESDLRVDHLRRPLLPGTYYGYCPALIVRRDHEAASPLLLSSFVEFLENLAARDILLHGLGTISCSAGGEQICRDLGMTRLGSHDLEPAYGVWNLPGSAIPASIFARRSPLLRRCYAEAFPG